MTSRFADPRLSNTRGVTSASPAHFSQPCSLQPALLSRMGEHLPNRRPLRQGNLGMPDVEEQDDPILLRLVPHLVLKAIVKHQRLALRPLQLLLADPHAAVGNAGPVRHDQRVVHAESEVRRPFLACAPLLFARSALAHAASYRDLRSAFERREEGVGQRNAPHELLVLLEAHEEGRGGWAVHIEELVDDPLLHEAVPLPLACKAGRTPPSDPPLGGLRGSLIARSNPRAADVLARQPGSPTAPAPPAAAGPAPRAGPLQLVGVVDRLLPQAGEEEQGGRRPELRSGAAQGALDDGGGRHGARGADRPTRFAVSCGVLLRIVAAHAGASMARSGALRHDVQPICNCAMQRPREGDNKGRGEGNRRFWQSEARAGRVASSCMSLRLRRQQQLLLDVGHGPGGVALEGHDDGQQEGDDEQDEQDFDGELDGLALEAELGEQDQQPHRPRRELLQQLQLQLVRQEHQPGEQRLEGQQQPGLQGASLSEGGQGVAVLQGASARLAGAGAGGSVGPQLLGSRHLVLLRLFVLYQEPGRLALGLLLLLQLVLLGLERGLQILVRTGIEELERPSTTTARRLHIKVTELVGEARTMLYEARAGLAAQGRQHRAGRSGDGVRRHLGVHGLLRVLGRHGPGAAAAGVRSVSKERTWARQLAFLHVSGKAVAGEDGRLALRDVGLVVVGQLADVGEVHLPQGFVGLRLGLGLGDVIGVGLGALAISLWQGKRRREARLRQLRHGLSLRREEDGLLAALHRAGGSGLFAQRLDQRHEVVDAGAEAHELRVVTRQDGQRVHGPHLLQAVQHDSTSYQRRQQHGMEHHLHGEECDEPQQHELIVVAHGEEYHPDDAEQHEGRQDQHGQRLLRRRHDGVGVQLGEASKERSGHQGQIVPDPDHRERLAPPQQRLCVLGIRGVLAQAARLALQALLVVSQADLQVDGFLHAVPQRQSQRQRCGVLDRHAAPELGAELGRRGQQLQLAVVQLELAGMALGALLGQALQILLAVQRVAQELVAQARDDALQRLGQRHHEQRDQHDGLDAHTRLQLHALALCAAPLAARFVGIESLRASFAALFVGEVFAGRSVVFLEQHLEKRRVQHHEGKQLRREAHHAHEARLLSLGQRACQEVVVVHSQLVSQPTPQRLLLVREELLRWRQQQQAVPQAVVRRVDGGLEAGGHVGVHGLSLLSVAMGAKGRQRHHEEQEERQRGDGGGDGGVALVVGCGVTLRLQEALA
eukprot:scaffold602_cov298-Pinguiococcus_pyrenoidosus.AAC.47